MSSAICVRDTINSYFNTWPHRGFLKRLLKNLRQQQSDAVDMVEKHKQLKSLASKLRILKFVIGSQHLISVVVFARATLFTNRGIIKNSNSHGHDFHHPNTSLALRFCHRIFLLGFFCLHQTLLPNWRLLLLQ